MAQSARPHTNTSAMNFTLVTPPRVDNPGRRCELVCCGWFPSSRMWRLPLVLCYVAAVALYIFLREMALWVWDVCCCRVAAGAAVLGGVLHLLDQ